MEENDSDMFQDFSCVSPWEGMVGVIEDTLRKWMEQTPSELMASTGFVEGGSLHRIVAPVALFLPTHTVRRLYI